MSKEEKVCDECGFPIEHKNGKLEDLVLFNGKYYCKDICLKEAINKFHFEQMKKNRMFIELRNMYSKFHDEEIVDMLDMLAKKFGVKIC